jgi:hypothetical protein
MLNNTAAFSGDFCILICYFDFLFLDFYIVWGLVLEIWDFGGGGRPLGRWGNDASLHEGY